VSEEAELRSTGMNGKIAGAGVEMTVSAEGSSDDGICVQIF